MDSELIQLEREEEEEKEREYEQMMKQASVKHGESTHEMLSEIKKEDEFANFNDADSESGNDLAEKPNESVMIKTNHVGNFRDKHSLDNQSLISSVQRRNETIEKGHPRERDATPVQNETSGRHQNRMENLSIQEQMELEH